MIETKPLHKVLKLGNLNKNLACNDNSFPSTSVGWFYRWFE